MEDDTFSVRVGKIFGSLAGPSSASRTSGPPPSQSSLWSLTDEEIERKEWKRDKGSTEAEAEHKFDFETQPYNYNSKSKSKGDFSDELEKDLLDLDDDDVDVDVDEEEEEDEKVGAPSSSSQQHKNPGDFNDEEWEIKSCIGLDCTLDYEEEEDKYDKVAVGKDDHAEHRLYMGDVNDYGIDIDSQDQVPTSFKDFTRDPRANHLAAKIRLQQDAQSAAQVRLQQDAEAVQKIDSLTVSGHDSPPALSAQVVTSDLKSILKRKNDDQFDTSKTQKRVRFNPDCKTNGDQEWEPVEAHSNEDPRVPDYVRNPSRYTHYTFDSSDDVDDESNKQAYVDFINLLGKANNMEPQAEDSSVDLSKPVTFIPRKKSTDAVMLENDGEQGRLGGGARKESASGKGMPLAIAAEDTEDVCAMDEDEPHTATDGITTLQKTGRQYRTKTKLESD